MLDDANLSYVAAGTGAIGVEALPSLITIPSTPRSNTSGVALRRQRLSLQVATELARASAGISDYWELIDSVPRRDRQGRAPSTGSAMDYRRELLETLNEMAKLKAGWNGDDSPKPKAQSIAAAKSVVRALPTTAATVTIGLGGDGNVFIHASHEAGREVYITVEAAKLHLLAKAPGRESEYIDDERFDRKVVPGNILEAFQRNLQ